MIVMLVMLSSIWLMSDMLENCMRNFMVKNGPDLILKKFVKFAMQGYKVLLNYWIIFVFQTHYKEIIDIDLSFI